MKSIKSFDCLSAARYGIALNTFLFWLTFPIAAIITITNLGFTLEIFAAFLLKYLMTFLFTGLFGGALTSFLLAFTYNLISHTLGPIKAEFE